MSTDPSTPEYSRFLSGWRLPFKGFRHWVQFATAWVFLTIARLLPVGGAQRVGRWMGKALFPVTPRDRAIMEYQLGLAFPDVTTTQRRAMAMRTYQNLGMTLWELFSIPRMRKKGGYWVKLEGEADLQAAHAEGKGVILVTGHMANWELLGIAFEQVQIPAQAVVRGFDNRRLNDLLMRNRESSHLKFFERGSRESPRRLLNCLREGSVLVVALDHDTVAPSVFVDFFGRPAHTPRVAASLGLRMGVPIVTGFDERKPDGTHLFHFRRMTYPGSLKNDAEGIQEVTQLLSTAIEAHIRQFPEQWTWNHRRWKRRPETSGAPSPSG